MAGGLRHHAEGSLHQCSYAIIIPLMKFRLLVEFDSEAKRWSAVLPELAGCATAGDTEETAITNAQEALALWFEPAPVKLPKGGKNDRDRCAVSA